MQEIVQEPLKMATLAPAAVDFDPSNVRSILAYLWHHRLQMLLLVLVGVMVYYVDHLSNVNAVLFGPPGMVASVATVSANAKQAFSKGRRAAKKS